MMEYLRGRGNNTYAKHHSTLPYDTHKIFIYTNANTCTNARAPLTCCSALWLVVGHLIVTSFGIVVKKKMHSKFILVKKWVVVCMEYMDVCGVLCFRFEHCAFVLFIFDIHVCSIDVSAHRLLLHIIWQILSTRNIQNNQSVT